MTGEGEGGDRRVKRTRAALIEAFNELVLKDRKKTIKVSDIVERANVGRSTFYEHYANADDIHMQALSHPFSILADAIVGAAELEKLSKLLSHFWENRRRARTTLDGATRPQAARLLAQLVEDRLASREGEPLAPVRLISMQLAEGSLALIRGWIAGEASASTEALSAAIIRSSQQSLLALFPERT
jgi:AcrR family transcriptional regulator